MKNIYNLKNDVKYIKSLQQATLSKNGYGLKNTHGLVGSKEWWNNIKTGDLKLEIYEGKINKVIMAGHNDYPMFELRTEQGASYKFYRYVDCESYDSYYKVGANVKVSFVIQEFKRPSHDMASSEIITSIEIED